MPLSRGREQILTTANGVEFLMQDSGLEVPCEATPELLAGRFDSEGTPLSQQQAFLFHRIAIEQAASAKYDAGGERARYRSRDCRYGERHGFAAQSQILKSVALRTGPCLSPRHSEQRLALRPQRIMLCRSSAAASCRRWWLRAVELPPEEGGARDHSAEIASIVGTVRPPVLSGVRRGHVPGGSRARRARVRVPHLRVPSMQIHRAFGHAMLSSAIACFG